MNDEKVGLFIHSGEYDKIYNALSIAIAAVSNNIQVFCLFSYSALSQLKKENINKIIIENDENELTQKFSDLLKENRIQSISDMIKMAKTTENIKIYACSASMNILNIKEEELIDDVDNTIGIVKFLELIEKSMFVLYI